MPKIFLISLLLALSAIASSYQYSSSMKRSFGQRLHSNIFKGQLPMKNSHFNIQSSGDFSLHVSLSADPFKSSSISRRSSGITVSEKSSAPPSLNEQIQEPEQIDLLFDSKCPICMMEVEFLRKRDIHNKIRFTDLQSADYNPADHGNVQFAEGMRKIRAVLPDKTVVMGVEVFRQTYDAIGLGWIFSVTKLPVIGYIADFIYDVWAENRLRLTGREELAEELKERAQALRELEFDEDCNSEACGIDYDSFD
jgi:predicted DCC family thiol-disulfide oxidoreductase YuxK